jgi:hypothetical protein
VGDAEVEVGFDVVDAVDEEAARFGAVAALEGGEDAGVIGMAAARGAGAAVEGDHQRGAGDELFHEALEDDVAGDFGKQEVEVARGPDFGAARGRPTLAKKLGFVAEPLTEGGDVGGTDALGGGDRERGLDKAARVEDLPRLLRDESELKLAVEGDTDNIGTDEYNLKLSADRAAGVVAALVSEGVAADRLTPSGAGATNPIADNATAEGRAKNRRVELTKAN